MQGFELFFPAAVSRTKLVYAGIPSLALSYLELIDSDPTIWWKSLEHRHQELETARPVADQEHHADKVEYAHEHACHVQELKKRKTVKNCWKTDLELVEDDPAIFGEALEHWDKKLQAARPMAHQ